METQLLIARDGKIVVENLDDRKNFANLIARQGTLVENLELQKRRANELEERVLKEEKEYSDNESRLSSSRLVGYERVNVATQTNPSDVPISNQVIMEQDDDYPEDFDHGRSPSRVLSEIPLDASSHNISRTEKMDISARVKELNKISFDIDKYDDAQPNPADTIESVRQEVDTAKSNQDLQSLLALRAKERILLSQEIGTLRETLIKKNQLINVTLESQEKLVDQ